MTALAMSVWLGMFANVAAPSPAPAPVLQAEARRIAAIERAKPSVLAIFSSEGGGGGSGVVITPDGYALTNYHVAKPCGAAMKCGLPDGKVYDAVVVGLDPTGDVALLKLFGRTDFPAATLGDSDAVEQGDWVYVMGNPFLLATDFQPTVTYGILSGVHRYQPPAGTLLEYGDCLQTDASINPGNSGGPLFDAQSRLIGINGRGSFEKRGRVNVGVGYAISINQIKNFLGHLHSGRLVDHATLGARVAFDAQNRVVVSDILEHSDAYRRGLRYGDEIVSFFGRSIDTPNAFKNALGIIPKGWRVPLAYRRDGKRYDTIVRLAGVHRTEELIEKATAAPPEMPGPKPKPKPKKDQKPGPPAPKQGPQPEIPVPNPHDELNTRRAPAPLPEIVKKHFEAKRGFANYYYNTLNRDRVDKAWMSGGDVRQLSGPWTITARFASGNPLKLIVTDKDASLHAGDKQWRWQSGQEGATALDPPGSGGLLLALHLWRRLAVQGPKAFGDVSYLGSNPLPGSSGPAEVLQAIHAGVECLFYFDPGTGRLLAIEMFPAPDTDPCEIYFSDDQDTNGRGLPRRIEVRHGNDTFGTFQIESYKFDTSPTPPSKETLDKTT